ncbi:MFS transporter [Jiangella ureilytica]|uniref:MFS transporter n=1 Tax=Jiangella ureilytica TaxID=2530374 RepID=A0A4R4S000_9ACTN|nr:MFS transporter [Jiangella ureilytica]TDC54622.1 MFS transporter [Jiangella ureilytica]
MHAYRRLLGLPGVARLVVAAAIGRLAIAMLALALLLTVLDHEASAGPAGLALGAHALGVAAGGPVMGRVADIIGGRRLLLAGTVVHAAAHTWLLASLVHRAPVIVLVAAAAVVGLTTPPAGPVTRALWPRLVPGEHLPTAYAFDSAMNSAMFVAGPLLAGILAAGISPLAAVVVAAAGKIAGDLLLATSPLVGTAEPEATARTGSRLGPLAIGRVRVLLGVVALDTFVYGALEIGAAAAAADAAWTATLIALLAAGEIAGGLGYGARGWRGGRLLHLAALHAVSAGLVLAGLAGWLAGGVVVLAAVFLLLGVASGARDTVTQLVLGETAPPDRRTETFGWLNTFMWTGYGLGTAAAGRLAELGGTASVYLVAAAAAGLGVVVIALTAVRTSAGSRR